MRGRVKKGTGRWLEERSGVVEGSLKVSRDHPVLFVTVLEEGVWPLQYLQQALLSYAENSFRRKSLP